MDPHYSYINRRNQLVTATRKASRRHTVKETHRRRYTERKFKRRRSDGYAATIKKDATGIISANVDGPGTRIADAAMVAAGLQRRSF